VAEVNVRALEQGRLRSIRWMIREAGFADRDDEVHASMRAELDGDES